MGWARFATPVMKVTSTEVKYLQDERRRAIQEARNSVLALRMAWSGNPQGPRCYLRVVDRDRDGSVRAVLRIPNPDGGPDYVRRLRTPAAKPSPRELRSYLRLA